ncbi:hypothetical protein TNCV_1387001 [Trichonephila clavipes]|nr:hypothetical protein TNCV_1387001 [Trichonephila clavipes]
MRFLLGVWTVNSPQSHIVRVYDAGHGKSGVFHSAEWHVGDWLSDGIREAWLMFFIWVITYDPPVEDPAIVFASAQLILLYLDGCSCLPRHALLAKDLVTWQAMVGRHILEDIVGRVAQYVDEHYPVDNGTWAT